MPKKPALTLISPAAAGVEPPRPLGRHGLALWRNVMTEYGISDTGGIELLAQACAALDRAEALGARIAEDGEIVYVKSVPKAHPALREELAWRAFICRTLQRLGLNIEAVRPVGRPGAGVGWRGE